MKLTIPLFLALGLAGAAAAGPFDDLSDGDRTVLRDEIRAYLLENPEVLMEAIAVLEDRQRESAASADAGAIETHREALFNDGVSHVAGNPEGDVTIVEFLDYQCGFCKRAHPEVAELLQGDGNIRLVQKEFPILGPRSEAASRAALAVLLDQGPEIYAAFSDRLMTHQGQLSDSAIAALARESGADVDRMRLMQDSPQVADVIHRNRALAAALQVSGTPTFVFGDQMVRGYIPLAQMEALVAELREEM